jgi:hypothetical protein
MPHARPSCSAVRSLGTSTTEATVPHELGIDAVVVVRQDDAQADDVAPRDLGELRSTFVGHRPGRLADHLEQAFDRQPRHTIRLPRLP